MAINGRNLEEFRQNALGASYIIVNSKPSIRVYLTYMIHLHNAFYGTINDVMDLEHTNSFVHNGRQTHTSISSWFLALEAFINSIVKLCCIKGNIEFEPLRNSQLHKRLSTLIDILGIDKAEFNRNHIISRVKDFGVFRNELFHDRLYTDKLKYQKATFSELPFFCNQTDTIEAATIFIELATSLRYVIKGLDIMPHFLISTPNVIKYEKVDIGYNQLIKPYFIETLKKLNINANVDANLKAPQCFSSDFFLEEELTPMFIVDQEKEYDHQISDIKTALFNPIYATLVNTYNISPDIFIAPNFYVSQ